MHHDTNLPLVTGLFMSLNLRLSVRPTETQGFASASLQKIFACLFCEAVIHGCFFPIRILFIHPMSSLLLLCLGSALGCQSCGFFSEFINEVDISVSATLSLSVGMSPPSWLMPAIHFLC